MIGFTGADSRGGEEYPRRCVPHCNRIAEFNRDVDEFADDIVQKARRLWQPSPVPIPKTLAYLDRMFSAANWMGSYYRRCFTWALKARYGLWAVMAFLLITFKKESVGTIAVVAILGVLAVFLLGTLLATWAHRRAWHRKYLDYRALAEALRVDFYWELAGVRKEFEGEFAHESFLQKADADLQWIRNAMRRRQSGIGHSSGGKLQGRLSLRLRPGSETMTSSTAPVRCSITARGLHILSRKQHSAERVDQILLFTGLLLAVAFAVDLAAHAMSHTLSLPPHLAR